MLFRSELAQEYACRIRQLGAKREAFETIIASGPHASLPHAKPTNRCLRKGELVTIDCGVILDGYCSDMTRTVAVGRPSDEDRQLYYRVLESQKRAFALIRPGERCSRVDQAARALLEEYYPERFPHNLGHSLGLGSHENPRFRPGDETRLLPGMVLSVEPGVYLPEQTGVRIEDVVAVTEAGFQNLTHFTKELLEL